MKKVAAPLLLILACMGARAGVIVCPNDSFRFTKVINVGFSYRGAEVELRGVDIDRRNLSELGAKFGKTTVHYTDANVGARDRFLAELRKQGQGQSSIMFNYSGHGILLPSGEFAMLLPGVPSSCVIKNPRKGSGPKLYRGLVSKKRLTRAAPTAPDAPGAESDEVFDDTNRSCMEYVVTGSDLKEVFRGKNVGGIIDACYSGAIQDSGFGSFLFSSRRDETSFDTGGGGLLISTVARILKDQACLFDPKHDGHVQLSSVLEALPPVLLAPKARYAGDAPVETLNAGEKRLARTTMTPVESLPSDILQRRYQIQRPSQTSRSALACVQTGYSARDCKPMASFGAKVGATAIQVISNDGTECSIAPGTDITLLDLRDRQATAYVHDPAKACEGVVTLSESRLRLYQKVPKNTGEATTPGNSSSHFGN